MSVTTDFNGKNTRALLLGSGELGKEVTIELMRMGVEVIAADRYANAPAMQVAQKHVVMDMRDEDALINLVHKLQPDYIIPEIEAIATSALLTLEGEGYKVIPSANAANTTMNREEVRRLAAEVLSLPTSPYFFASSVEEIEEKISTVGFPCVMKPIMSSSGKGQSVLKSVADIETAFNYAVSNGRGGMDKVIVEGFIKFNKEITLLTVNAVDGIHFCEPIGHHQVNGDYRESWQPEPLNEEVMVEAKRIASTIISALGGYGIFGVELFIVGNNVIFSELSPRPHDTGMVTMISQDQSEFALHVRALLGLPVGKITQISPAASAAIVAEGDGDVITYGNLNEALAVTPMGQLRIFGKPEVHGERRVGVCLARGFSIEDALLNAKKMRSLIEVKISKYE